MDIFFSDFAKRNQKKRCPFETFFRRRRRWNTFLHNLNKKLLATPKKTNNKL